MNIAVVGGGSIGKRHIGNLLHRGVSAEQIHLIEPREDRREEATQRFQLESCWKSIEDLRALRFEIAIIASPTALHTDHSLAFIEQGATLFLEKPLDASLARAQQLAERIQRGGNRALVGYPFRFSDAAAKLRELAHDGTLGRALHLHGEFSEYLPDWHPYEDYRGFYMAKQALGGGSLLDQSHIVDLAHWVFGPLAAVFGFTGKVSSLEVETDDLAEMHVRFRSGLVGTLHQDMFGRKHRKQLHVKLERGELAWDAATFCVERFARESGTTTRFEFERDHQIMYRRELDHLFAVHAGRERPLCSIEDGLHGMRVIEAVRRSMTSNSLEKVD